MAFAQVQTAWMSGGSNQANSIAMTISAAGAGNLIVGHIRMNGKTETCTGVTDDKGNTYVVLAAVDSSDERSYQFYGVQVTGGATTITVTFSGSSLYKRMAIDEYSGGAASNAAVFDVSQTGSGTINQGNYNIALSSFSPGASGNLIVTTLQANNNMEWSAGSGYTLYGGGNPSTIRSQYKLSSGSSETSPASVAEAYPVNWTMRATSFKPGATGQTVDVSDTITLTGTIENLRELLSSISDSLSLTEAMTALRSLLSDIADSIGLTGSVTAGPPPTIDLSDAVLYLKFDESSGNAIDSSGNGNNLINVNSTPYVSGKVNNGANFVAANSNYFYIPYEDMVNLNILGSISFAFCIKSSSQPSGAYPYYHILNRWDEAGNQRAYSLTYWWTGTVYRLQFAIANDPAGSGVTDVYAHDIELTDDADLHIGIAWNAAEHTLKFYVNGSLVHTDTGVQGYTAIPNATSPLRIGCFLDANYPAGRGFVDALLDELGIWPRELSGDEYAFIYNSGNIKQYPFCDFLVSLSESIGLSETLSNIRNLLSSVSDTISHSETIETVKVLLIDVMDSLNISGAITAVRSFVIGFLEAIGLSSLISTSKPSDSTPTISVSIELLTANIEIEISGSN